MPAYRVLAGAFAAAAPDVDNIDLGQPLPQRRVSLPIIVDDQGAG